MTTIRLRQDDKGRYIVWDGYAPPGLIYLRGGMSYEVADFSKDEVVRLEKCTIVEFVRLEDLKTAVDVATKDGYQRGSKEAQIKAAGEFDELRRANSKERDEVLHNHARAVERAVAAEEKLVQERHAQEAVLEKAKEEAATAGGELVAGILEPALKEIAAELRSVKSDLMTTCQKLKTTEFWLQQARDMLKLEQETCPARRAGLKTYQEAIDENERLRGAVARLQKESEEANARARCDAQNIDRALQRVKVLEEGADNMPRSQRDALALKVGRQFIKLNETSRRQFIDLSRVEEEQRAIEAEIAAFVEATVK